MGRADGTAARGDSRFLVVSPSSLRPGRRRSESGSRSGCPRAISSPWAYGLSARWVTLFVVRKRRENDWRPCRGGYQGSLPVGDGPGGFQPRTHRGHHKTRFRVSRWNSPLAATAHRLVVVSHPYRRNPIPRSHHECEERSLRAPFRPGGSGGPRLAGGSLAGHRVGAGRLVLVRADGVRGARRQPIAVRMRFRPGHGVMRVVTAAWDPPRMFAAESPGWTPEMPSMATEWSVEARAGGVCLVRVVHSLFASTDGWDNRAWEASEDQPGFFRTLRLYLTHFRGQRSAIMQKMAVATGTEAEVWETLTAALGLNGVNVGQRWTAPAGVPAPACGGVPQPESLRRLAADRQAGAGRWPPLAPSTSAARAWLRHEPLPLRRSVGRNPSPRRHRCGKRGSRSASRCRRSPARANDCVGRPSVTSQSTP